MHARSTLATLMVLAMVAITPSAVIRASGPTVTVEDLGPTGVVTNGRGVNASGLAVGFGNDGDHGLWIHPRCDMGVRARAGRR